MGTVQGPFEWLCGWSKICCQLCCSCCRIGSLCPSCGSECCLCQCCPAWCPRKADQIAPDEVTAGDYLDLDIEKQQAQVDGTNRIKTTIISFCFFLFGIGITTMYAYAVLIIKSYNMWFCLVTTISLGAFMCLGMAFSERFRITVLLMLPTLFSGHIKALLLMLIMGLAMQGPGANIMENYQRSSNSVACGMETIKNQTKTLFEKVRKPLVSAIKLIQKLMTKMKSMVNGAKEFLGSIKNGMKFLEATLKQIWKFITSIGQVCNDEMLNPYKNCLLRFDEGKKDCFDRGFGPICNLVEGFKWLCGLAKIVTIVCIIPDQVGQYIEKYIKNPTMSMMNNLKEKFDYNITVIHDFGVNVNSSKGIITILRDIVDDVKEDLDPYREFFQMFSYSVFFVCLYTYIQALQYRRKYIFNDDHDNIYITRRFVELDVMRVKQNQKPLLPLSPNEAYDFVRPAAFHLTQHEKAGYKFEIINVFRSMLVVLVIILSDYIVYAILTIVARQLEKDMVLKPPATAEATVSGIGFMSMLLSKLIAAFDVVQKGNITAVARRCIPYPSEPDYMNYTVIAIMYLMVYVASIGGVYIQRTKRWICASYYPFREQERICFLYNSLLTKRMSLKDALMNSIRMKALDEGHSSILLILAAKCPGFRWFAGFMGASEQCCMACARMSTPSTSQDFLPCITSGCKGLYCRECCEVLENICIICMAPLAHTDLDEEMDSSDDEKINLWIEAMETFKKEEKAKRKKMKEKIKQQLREIVKRRGLKTPVIERYRHARTMMASDTESSEFSEPDSDAVSSVTDYNYQDMSEDSDLESFN
ncbi:DC-STAMP domain-containing protein 2 [Gastrophryne carolinensis]